MFLYILPIFSIILAFFHRQDSMQSVNFTLNDEFIALNQLLKLVGLCSSGGGGKMLVASGMVSVNGQVELRKTCKIRAGQVICLGDVCIRVMQGNLPGGD